MIFGSYRENFRLTSTTLARIELRFRNFDSNIVKFTYLKSYFPITVEALGKDYHRISSIFFLLGEYRQYVEFVLHGRR